MRTAKVISLKSFEQFFLIALKTANLEVEYLQVNSFNALYMLRIDHYQYRTKDYSLLTPYLRNYLAAPLIPYLPYGLTANFITIISNLFMFAALYLAIDKGAEVGFHFWLIPLLIFGYLLGDHLDGMQAKRTKTGSPLGEFFDHYLDTFNNGILMTILFCLFDVQDPLVIGVVMWVSYLTHGAVFYEQFVTGWLIFEKFGSFESVVFVFGIILLAMVPDVHALMMAQGLWGFKNIELGFLLSGVGPIVTFVYNLFRTRKISLRFSVFMLLFPVVCFGSAYAFTALSTFAIITLYGSHYIGNLMKAHLVDGKERWPDALVPGFLAVTFLVLDKTGLPWAAEAIILYLCGLVAYQSISTFVPLRKFWFWVNPVR